VIFNTVSFPTLEAQHRLPVYELQRRKPRIRPSPGHRYKPDMWLLRRSSTAGISFSCHPSALPLENFVL
jgi:hypothetical protein